jgi:polysaccharide deacetylase family protein (PEP-CTERM system associated)
MKNQAEHNTSCTGQNQSYPEAKAENSSFRGVVTVLLHDYFHRGIFKEIIGEKQWNRFESRLEKNVEDACELLDRFSCRATFFTLGWIAEKYPKIVRRLTSRGHEIASAGYYARSIREMSPRQFREDIIRSKAALEDAGSNRVLGYRCAYKTMHDGDQWALEVLADEGYLYDASYRPPLFEPRNGRSRRFLHKHTLETGEIWELPISTTHVLGFNLPIAGGNYLRQFPADLMLSFFHKWCRQTDAPFVLYFHPWELDSSQPVINAVGFLSKIRQYRNLGKLQWVLPNYLGQFSFCSVARYLEAPLTPGTREHDARSRPIQKEKAGTIEHKGGTGPRTPVQVQKRSVSVIVPCFNEESSISYLARTLEELVSLTSSRYTLSFLFVDDASTDRTADILQDTFDTWENCTVVLHEKNKGIAAAIRSGVEAADTDIVCSIDADCSYDPLDLVHMIPLLGEDTDLVTASPYHEDGSVLNVPGWRLSLSRSLSRLYHVFLRHKLSTYTSCFRVYRRTTALNVDVKYEDYRGIVELLAKIDLQGGNIVEYPATLQCRIFGHSKMKTVKTIAGHLKLLYEMLAFKRNLKRKPQEETYKWKQKEHRTGCTGST